VSKHIKLDCIQCGESFERGINDHCEQRNKCWSCRDFRPKHMRKEKDYKGIASRILNYEIRCGRVPRITKNGEDNFICVDCGARATGYDHRDYRKPLEIEPVCQSCNYHRGPGLPYEKDYRKGKNYDKRLKAAIRLVKASDGELAIGLRDYE